jgi:hypothetical protein
MNYKVPTTICMKSTEDSETVLGLGGVLALADELTTITLMACDRSHRPGVSVLLTGIRVILTVTVITASENRRELL